MVLNRDLNMLSDPEHPQVLEHLVQLKAGGYNEKVLVYVLITYVKLKASGLKVAHHIIFCGPQKLMMCMVA